MIQKKDYNFKLETRYIAFCDVIGFKNLIMSEKLVKIANNYNKLILEVKKIASRVSIPELNYFKDYELNNAIFSDTILVWSDVFNKTFDNIWKYDHYFLNMVSLLFNVGIKYDLPLRIGIAYGECIIEPEKNIFLGLPLINAYYTEGEQEWIGIGCHPSCLESPIKSKLCFSTQEGIQLGPLIYYPVPIKNRCNFSINYTLNWINWFSDIQKEKVEDYIKFKIVNTEKKNNNLKWKHTLDYFKHRANKLKNIPNSFIGGYYHPPEV